MLVTRSRLEILNNIETVSIACKKCPHLAYKTNRNRDMKYCLTSCSVGAELKKLGEELSTCKSKTKMILDKGSWMTKSDVTYLVKIGVPKSEIQKATGIRYNAFTDIINAWGLGDARGRRKAN